MDPPTQVGGRAITLPKGCNQKLSLLKVSQYRKAASAKKMRDQEQCEE